MTGNASGIRSAIPAVQRVGHPLIERVLVANRAEIAERIFATCRRLGIGTAAVVSDADEHLGFVKAADVAVRLPGSAPADTYLRGDLIIAAAKACGADAIHPGYGFLSERGDFAQAVIDAGLTWIGPTPDSMAAMGDKQRAKELVGTAGVPVLPELDPFTLRPHDLPVLIKASAGGGGRGMRIVRDVAEIAAGLATSRDEASSAFGDGRVFCEPLIERGRHVEVQVVGDTHGNVLILGERDCSIQRRHQKVIEESPAPDLDPDVRDALHEAARDACLAVGYVGAGTVEFLLDTRGDADRFYFLEMNTRLQVEHPVTECVTGLDLVALQLRVAEGGILPIEAPTPSGHAIEVRLYAEDPAAGYLPQSGRLTAFEIPDVTSRFDVPAMAQGVRLDAGFRSGDEVGTSYDAMLAKVIAWAPTRAEAARRLAGVLRRATIHGVTTNRDLLVSVLRSPRFLAEEVHTGFLEESDLGVSGSTPQDPPPPRPPDADRVAGRPDPPPSATPVSSRQLAAAAATLVHAQRARTETSVQHGIPMGWRNVPSAPRLTTASDLRVSWLGGRDRITLVEPAVEVVEVTTTSATLAIDGVRRTFTVALGNERRRWSADVDSDLGHVRVVADDPLPDPADHVAPGSLTATMPGSVIAVLVAPGDVIAAGQPVVLLEAMKMQQTVTAPAAGRVTEVGVTVGDQVTAGQVLLTATDSADADHPRSSPT